MGDADLYYVTSSAEQAHDVDIRFRVTGKEAEIWHPDTGTLEPASFTIADGRTTVRVPMTAHDALFVVFRRPTSALARTVPRATLTTLGTVRGAWQVRFPPDLGAPPSITLAALGSLTASADSGVKYFSGTATYAISPR